MDPYLQRLQTEIRSAVAGMSPKQLGWHPPGKWCGAEILEHLYLTYTGTSKGLGRVLAAGKSLATNSTWRQRYGAVIVVTLGYLPAGREAPAVTRPRGMPTEKVVVEIESKLVEMDAIMARCDAEFGPRAKILDHPILGAFSLKQWRKFHLVHGLHHVRQIRALQGQLRVEVDIRNPNHGRIPTR